MARDTRPEDYLGVLKSLSDVGCSYFLEGGQAVNFWAEYFTLREGAVIALEKYQPFTSKDCDLWVSMAALKHFEAKLDGQLKKGTSPADGQLAVFTTRGKPPLKIDLMSGVFGISPADIGRLEKRALVVRGIKLLLQIGRDGWVRQALKKAELTLADAIPIEALRSCGFEKIERFIGSTWPAS